MKCPFCQSENHRIIDTRRYDTVVIRIRLCLGCSFSFETCEQLRANTPHSYKIISTLIPKKST